MKRGIVLFILVSILLVSSVSALDACIEVTRDGEYCVYTDESNYGSGSMAYTSCEQTSYCQMGCCYGSEEGRCFSNTAKAACEAQEDHVWSDDETCEIEQCTQGCCVLADQAFFVTEVRCKQEATSFEDVTMVFDESITSESACLASVKNQEFGCCVSGDSCSFTTREGCNSDEVLIGTNFTQDGFHEDMLCSNDLLACDCAKQQTTGCYQGKLYWYDSCGNRENVYSVDERVSYNGGYVIDEDEVCIVEEPNGEGWDGDTSCGNCDYATGTVCGYDEDINMDVGTDTCVDVNCYSTYEDDNSPYADGEDKLNGESWCIYDGPTGYGLDYVGSRHYRHICINGEEVVEECADYREEMCIHGVLTEEVFGTYDALNLKNIDGYIEAGCRENRGDTCSACNDVDEYPSGERRYDCCTNEGVHDCYWLDPDGVGNGDIAPEGDDLFYNEGVCAAQVPPGSQFWEGEDDICTAATTQCTVTYRAGGVTGGAAWKRLTKNQKASSFEIIAEEPEGCSSFDWLEDQNTYCRSLGDCGAYYNILGDDTDEGFQSTIFDETFFEPFVDYSKSDLDLDADINSYYDSALYADGFKFNNPKMLSNPAFYIAGLSFMGAGLSNLVACEGEAEMGALADKADTYMEESAWECGKGTYVDKECDAGECKDHKCVATTTTTTTTTTVTSDFTSQCESKGYVKTSFSSSTGVNAYCKYDSSKSEYWYCNPTNGNEDSSTTPDFITACNAAGVAATKTAPSEPMYAGALGQLVGTGGQIAGSQSQGSRLSCFGAGAAGIATSWQSLSNLKDSQGLDSLWAFGSTASSLFTSSEGGISDEQVDALDSISGLSSASYFKSFKRARGGYTGSKIMSGLGLATVAFLAVEYGLDNETTVTYNVECGAWVPPEGGENCEECNSNERPCSEYRCKSLGAACTLINEGTGNETCVSTAVNDVNSPIIEFIGEFVEDDYTYSEKTEESNKGVEINELIPAFTPVTLGINTDEPALCKYSLEPGVAYEDMNSVFGSGIYAYNHSVFFSLGDEITSEEVVALTEGEFTIYVRCTDFNGNDNERDYWIRFGVDSTPDLTPPEVIFTSIANNAYMPYGVNETEFSIYLNEPSTCRWALNDTGFEFMDNGMDCQTSGFEQSSFYYGTYQCTTELYGLDYDTINEYYFRCQDGSDNLNEESFELKLKATEEALEIDSISPEGELYNNSVTLRLETEGGAYGGVATCGYSTTDVDFYQMIEFYETNDSEHAQELTLVEGEYEYYFGCMDKAGNLDYNYTSFEIDVDVSAPAVEQIYYSSIYNTLNVVFDEDCSCEYASEEFTFGEGISMGTSGTEHEASLDRFVYYIVCEDNYANQGSYVIDTSFWF